jgi:hypothetical protein
LIEFGDDHRLVLAGEIKRGATAVGPSMNQFTEIEEVSGLKQRRQLWPCRTPFPFPSLWRHAVFEFGLHMQGAKRQFEFQVHVLFFPFCCARAAGIARLKISQLPSAAAFADSPFATRRRSARRKYQHPTPAPIHDFFHSSSQWPRSRFYVSLKPVIQLPI